MTATTPVASVVTSPWHSNRLIKDIVLTGDELKRVTAQAHVEAWVLAHLAAADLPRTKSHIAGDYVRELRQGYAEALHAEPNVGIRGVQHKSIEGAAGRAVERLWKNGEVVKGGAADMVPWPRYDYRTNTAEPAEWTRRRGQAFYADHDKAEQWTNEANAHEAEEAVAYDRAKKAKELLAVRFGDSAHIGINRSGEVNITVKPGQLDAFLVNVLGGEE